MVDTEPARGEAGTATTELVIAMPVLMLLVLVVVQFALWAHASHVATAAAQEGARAARVERGSVEAGHAQAQRYLDALGRRVVEGAEVTASRDRSVASVEVRGRAVSVIPGLSLPVRGFSRGPIEAFTAEAAP